MASVQNQRRRLRRRRWKNEPPLAHAQKNQNLRRREAQKGRKRRTGEARPEKRRSKALSAPQRVGLSRRVSAQTPQTSAPRLGQPPTPLSLEARRRPDSILLPALELTHSQLKKPFLFAESIRAHCGARSAVGESTSAHATDGDSERRPRRRRVPHASDLVKKEINFTYLSLTPRPRLWGVFSRSTGVQRAIETWYSRASDSSALNCCSGVRASKFLAFSTS